MPNSEFKYCNKVQCPCCAKLQEELEKARSELQSLKQIINIIEEEERSMNNIEFRPIETRHITPKTSSKIEDGRWYVVRPKCQKRNQDPKQLKQFKIPLVVNRPWRCLWMLQREKANQQLKLLEL
jgi:hypothetical protein